MAIAQYNLILNFKLYYTIKLTSELSNHVLNLIISDTVVGKTLFPFIRVKPLIFLW